MPELILILLFLTYVFLTPDAYQIFLAFTSRLAERQDIQEATIPNTGITAIKQDKQEITKQRLLRSSNNIEKPINQLSGWILRIADVKNVWWRWVDDRWSDHLDFINYFDFIFRVRLLLATHLDRFVDPSGSQLQHLVLG